MPIITDVLMTVFAVQGVQSTLGAMVRIEQANDRVWLAQQRLNAAAMRGNIYGYRAAQVGLMNAVRQRGMAYSSELSLAATTAAATIGVLVEAGRRAISVYSNFGKEVMNIRDLTGSSFHDSARFASLMRVAGMDDMSEIREFLRVGSSVFDAKGQQALGLLGIPANLNSTGLDMMNQIMDRLNGMQDGLLKTQIMEDLFGKRGVAAMLPLLRMTKEQRDAAMDLANTFSEADSRAIQEFQVSSALLGQTILQKIVLPIAARLVPIMMLVIKITGGVVEAFHRLDQIFGGALSWVLILVGIAVAVQRIISVVMLAINFFKLLNIQMGISALIQGIMSRNPAAIAAGVLALGLAGYGAYAAFNPGKAENSEETASSKFERAVDRFSSSVARMADEFGSLKGKNLPGGIGELDVQSLARQRALGAIG